MAQSPWVVHRFGPSRISSNSLRPIAPPALPGLNDPVDALTPVRLDLRTGRLRVGVRHMNTTLRIEQVSLLSVFGLPTIPSPTT